MLAFTCLVQQRYEQRSKKKTDDDSSLVDEEDGVYAYVMDYVHLCLVYVTFVLKN